MREHSIGKVWFKLSIKVLFGVNIDKANASITILIVKIGILNGNIILPTILQVRSWDMNGSFVVKFRWLLDDLVID